MVSASTFLCYKHPVMKLMLPIRIRGAKEFQGISNEFLHSAEEIAVTKLRTHCISVTLVSSTTTTICLLVELHGREIETYMHFLPDIIAKLSKMH